MKYSKIYHGIHRLYSLIPYHIFPNGYAFPPLQIFFELTYDCNLRCKMCQFLPLISNYHESEDKKNELTTDEVKSVIDQIPRWSLITFTGGEPFLRNDFIDILKYTSKKNTFHVVTNGTLLDKELVNNLVSLGCKSVFSKGLVMVGISLEGNQDVHDKIVGRKDSFSKTLEGIRLLNDFKAKRNAKFPLINVAVVISKWNYDFLSEMISLAEKNDINVLSFLSENRAPLSNRENMEITELQSYKTKPPEVDIETLRNQINIIRSKMNNTKVQIKFSPPGVPVQNIINQYDGNVSLSQYECYSFWSKIFITAKGNIFPCLPFNLGNIRTRLLKEIWNNQKAKEFRRHIKKNGVFPSCLGCCMLELPDKKPV